MQLGGRRQAADLLDGAVDGVARFDQGAIVSFAMRHIARKTIDHHLCGAELLAEPVVQFARDAAALFVLSDEQTARQVAQFEIEQFKLARLAMKLGKDADFRAQEFRVDRDGDVIDGAPLISLEAVEIGEVNRRDENDRSLLETRMLTNHVGKLEAIDLGHADIHQNDSDVIFEQ